MTDHELIAALRAELRACLDELEAGSGYDRQDEIRAALSLRIEGERPLITCNWCGKPHVYPAQSALEALANCCKG